MVVLHCLTLFFLVLSVVVLSCFRVFRCLNCFVLSNCFPSFWLCWVVVNCFKIVFLIVPVCFETV